MTLEEFVAQDVAAYKSYVVKNVERKGDELIEKIYQYLVKFRINDVVLGISGGIDSSLVLAILDEVRKRHLPTLNIHAVNIHFYLYDGIFDFSYIELLKKKYRSCVNFYDVDASTSLKILHKNDMKLPTSSQLFAQSSYALRYQMLFTYAQLTNGITFGTTNKDEFDYVGWFGKTSDMVVDIQPIIKFHKFEVNRFAEILGVPKEIIERTPTGDLLDKSSDEENFGCTYDELAWYYMVGKCINNKKFSVYIKKKFAKVEELHQKNIHKYQGQGFNPIFF